MELIIILLLLIVAFLMLMLFLRKPRVSEDSIKLAIKESLIDFQNNLSGSLERTRREVETSKDMLSQNAIQTIMTVKDIGQTVHALVEQQKKAESLAESLKYLLQSPKLRGNYGEMILEEMLAKVMPRGLWRLQATIAEKEKVDAVVCYREILIPIDAKFPKDDYQKYCEATDKTGKQAAWKAYEGALKAQINSIASKYIKPEHGTSEFALMFIPSEAMYYETIAEKHFLDEPSKILEYAQSKNVLPVSPNNFYAFLQIILMGVRNIEIVTSAKEIQSRLKEVERRFALFFTRFEDMGKAIEKASENYRVGRDHIGRFKNSLDRAIDTDTDDTKGNGDIDNFADQLPDKSLAET